MKKVLCFVIVFSLFVAGLPVFASGVSQIEPYDILVYENFESGVAGFEANNSTVNVDKITDSSDYAYKNTMYYKSNEGFYGTAGREISSPVYFDTPDNLQKLGANAYLQYSIDIKPDATENNRVIYVRLASASGSDNVGFALYVGTTTFKYGKKCTEKTANLGYNIKKNQWMNIKAVIQLTGDNCEQKYIMKHVFVNGTDVVSNVTDESTSFSYPVIGKLVFSAQKSNAANINVDNISLIKYNSIDGVCPVPDRHDFTKNIDSYIESSTILEKNGCDVTELNKLIDEAKALYQSDNFTSELVSDIKVRIENKINLADPSMEDYTFKFNFETPENKLKFDSYTNNYKIYERKDDSTYDIGTNYAYFYDKEKLYFDFDTPLNRLSAKMKDAYIEFEYDMMVTDEVSNCGLVVVGPRTYDANGKVSTNKYIGGVQYEKGTDHDLHGWYRTKKPPIGKWESNKWQRFKIIVKLNENGKVCTTGSHDIYIDGVKSGTFDDYSGSEASPIDKIYGFYMPNGNGVVNVDNIGIKIYTLENKPAEKGALISKIREFYSLYKSDYKYYPDVTTAFEKIEKVYYNDNATQEQIDQSIEQITSLKSIMENNINALNSLGKMIEIPGVSHDSENVTIPFMLHYGPKEGDDRFTDIFMNGESRKDFSNVEFVDRFGNVLNSEITSNGNYDFIYDKRLGSNNTICHFNDGTLITSKDGYVAFSSDDAKTWQKTSFRGNPEFVDRNENLYYNVTRDRGDGQNVGIYKLSKTDNYTNPKLVIDCSGILDGTEDRTMANKPPYLKDKIEPGDEVIFDASNIRQDDDGYLYFGRYQTTWVGVKLYVSDESGENFKCVDWRLDKQHNHAIRVNRMVYPNEVHITYDDTRHSPLHQVTTDRGGYDEIKDDPNYDDTKYEIVHAHAQKHFKQVPVPYQNCDYMGYFDAKDKNEDKFYTAGNGKRYTTPDNIFAIGCGEANILGGPTIYKTTDIWDQSKYYSCIDSTQGVRNVVKTPYNDMIMTGLLAGNYAQTEQIVVSYDEGEHWVTAFSEGISLSRGAGNGAMRTFTDYFTPKGSNNAQMIGFGYGDSSLRAKFNGNNYSALCYVTLDKLSKNGDKIFVRLNDSKSPSYDYSLEEIKYHDNSGKITDEKMNAKVLDKVILNKRNYNNEKAVIVAADYDSTGKLNSVVLKNVNGSGEYDVDLILSEKGNHKLFMIEGTESIRPLILKEYVPVNMRENKVVNNSLNTPVVRVKLDEGVGSEVHEAISNRQLNINGSHEWIDTTIRYGNELPCQTRSKTALRLGDSSSINIGNIPALEKMDFSKPGNDITIAFWTNTEVFGQRKGYEETDPYHESDSYGHIRCGNKFSNQDHHVILHNSIFDMCMCYNAVHFHINDKLPNTDEFRVPQPLLDTNYYNLYFVTIKGGENVNVTTYGNDGINPASNKTLTYGHELNFTGDLYIGTPVNSFKNTSALGLGDVMIFDRALSYEERLEVYHGINYYGAIGLE